MLDTTTREGVRDILALAAETDSQISDTNGDGVITIRDDVGFITVKGFETGSAATADRIDLSALGFTGIEQDGADVSAIVKNFTTDLTLITDLFAHHGSDHGVATTEIPLNGGGFRTFVFIDANKDGDFTAADDAFFEVEVTGSITPTDFTFA